MGGQWAREWPLLAERGPRPIAPRKVCQMTQPQQLQRGGASPGQGSGLCDRVTFCLLQRPNWAVSGSSFWMRRSRFSLPRNSCLWLQRMVSHYLPNWSLVWGRVSLVGPQRGPFLDCLLFWPVSSAKTWSRAIWPTARLSWEWIYSCGAWKTGEVGVKWEICGDRTLIVVELWY